MIARIGIPAKAVYINNLNTGKTARTWAEVVVAVRNFAHDLFPGDDKALARLLNAFGIPSARFDLCGKNSVETPKSFTVTLERPKAVRGANEEGAEEGVPF